MPYVTCPTCGERGKIPSSLIGVRIKCRKCGLSFQVAPASGTGRAEPSAGPSAAVEVHGIEVEGLDAAAWMVAGEPAVAVAAAPAADPDRHSADSGQVVAATSADGQVAREYKLLSSRDKIFNGKFDLARMEEAINHLARQGWAARGLITPHLKGYAGVLEEVIVVLLERDHQGE